MDIKIKQKIAESIEKKRDYIIDIGDRIYSHPETGFKEIRASRVVSGVLQDLGLDFVSLQDIPGLKATIDTGRAGPSIAILAELDAVICFDHPDCDKETGAVHACGHHTQVAALAGAAIGLLDSGILEEMSGKIHLIAVPAEEFIEVAYRMELRDKGRIRYLGGKTELLSRGFFDDVDLCMMIHSIDTEGKQVMLESGANGCLVKKIRYVGKAAHAGASPHEGVNALYAANLGLMAINAVRETFKESEYIRIHPIITKGGEIVNVIPSDVRLETFVRGKTMQNILDANRKTDRALAGGAAAMGAKVEIDDIPGYFPLRNDAALLDLCREIINDPAGSDNILEGSHSTGSTDLGDLSTLMPVVHPFVGGAAGGLHSAMYTVTDPDIAYLLASRLLASMAYELLREDGRKAAGIIREYKPVFATKEEYMQYADRLFSKKTLPANDIV
jgi:amidohydrolase